MGIFYGILYPTEDFYEQVVPGEPFPVIGTGFPSKTDAEKQLASEWDDVIAQALPVSAFVVETDRRGIVQRRHEVTPRISNPDASFGGMVPFFFSTSGGDVQMQMPDSRTQVREAPIPPVAPVKAAKTKVKAPPKEEARVRPPAKKAPKKTVKPQSEASKKREADLAAKTAAYKAAREKKAAAAKTARDALKGTTKKKAAPAARRGGVSPKQESFPKSELTKFEAAVTKALKAAKPGQKARDVGAKATLVPVNALDALIKHLGGDPSQADRGSTNDTLEKRRMVARFVAVKLRGKAPKKKSSAFAREESAEFKGRADKREAERAAHVAKKAADKKATAAKKAADKKAAVDKKVTEKAELATRLESAIHTVANALLTFYTYEVASKAWQSPHAAGQPYTVYGVRVKTPPATKVNSTLTAGLDLDEAQEKKVYEAAQEALKEEGIIYVRAAPRGGGVKAYFTGKDRAKTAKMVKAAVTATAKDHPAKNANRLAKRLLDNDYTGGKNAPSVPWASLLKSFKQGFNAADDCKAYHAELLKDPRKMPVALEKSIDEEIAKLLSDKTFLVKVSKWLAKQKQPRLRLREPFRMSLGFDPIGNADHVPHRMVGGMKVGWGASRKQEIIAPYLIRKGHYYTTTKNSKGVATKGTAARYCVANVGPLVEQVWKPAWRYFETMGEAMPKAEVLKAIRAKKAPAPRGGAVKLETLRKEVAKESKASKQGSRISFNAQGKQDIRPAGVKDMAEFSIAEIDQLAQDDPNEFAETVLTEEVFEQGGGAWDYELLSELTLDGSNPEFRKGYEVGGEVISNVKHGVGIAIKALAGNQHPSLSAHPKKLVKKGGAGGASSSKKAKFKESKSAASKSELELDFDIDDLDAASDAAFAGMY